MNKKRTNKKRTLSSSALGNIPITIRIEPYKEGEIKKEMCHCCCESGPTHCNGIPCAPCKGTGMIDHVVTKKEAAQEKKWHNGDENARNRLLVLNPKVIRHLKIDLPEVARSKKTIGWRYEDA